MRRASITAVQPFVPQAGSILSLRSNYADIWDSRAEASISFAVQACGAQRRSAGAASVYAIYTIVPLASTASNFAVRRPGLVPHALSGTV